MSQYNGGEQVKEIYSKDISKFIGDLINTKERTKLKGCNRLERLNRMEICDFSRMRKY